MVISGFVERQSWSFLLAMTSAMDERPAHVVDMRDLPDPRHESAIVEGRDGGYVVVMSDHENDPGDRALETMLRAISQGSTNHVTFVVTTSPDRENQILKSVHSALGLHPAHVPTSRVGTTKEGGLPKQPVLLSGHVSHNGSKRGERYMEIDEDGTPGRSSRFTVVAKDDQDDDDLNDALYGMLDGQVFVRLEHVDGELRCATSDMTRV